MNRAGLFGAQRKPGSLNAEQKNEFEKTYDFTVNEVVNKWGKREQRCRKTPGRKPGFQTARTCENHLR